MITATVTKIKDAEPVGTYQPTALDARKAASDFLLLQVSPYIIRWKNGPQEKVSERQLKKLQATHRWATDF